MITILRAAFLILLIATFTTSWRGLGQSSCFGALLDCGSTGAGAPAVETLQTTVVDGKRVYVLPRAAGDIGAIRVFQNGLELIPSVDFTRSGAFLAPTEGTIWPEKDIIQVLFVSKNGGQELNQPKPSSARDAETKRILSSFLDRKFIVQLTDGRRQDGGSVGGTGGTAVSTSLQNDPAVAPLQLGRPDIRAEGGARQFSSLSMLDSVLRDERNSRRGGHERHSDAPADLSDHGFDGLGDTPVPSPFELWSPRSAGPDASQWLGSANGVSHGGARVPSSINMLRQILEESQ